MRVMGYVMTDRAPRRRRVVESRFKRGIHLKQKLPVHIDEFYSKRLGYEIAGCTDPLSAPAGLAA